MKNKTLVTIATAIGLAAVAAVMATTPTVKTQTHKQSSEERKQDEQARLQSQARITMDQAKEIALRRAAGTVESGELEREHGKLVYSFDIRNAKGTITEVQVDAVTGKIARVEHENAKDEAKEKRREAKEQGAAQKP